MKVGTDALVLGSMAGSLALESPQRILDVGTGCGILALMMAQSFPESVVTGIEIESICAGEAKENILHSRFSKRVEIVHSSFQEFSDKQNVKAFNFILSNPPYFVGSLPSTEVDRSVARHTQSLSYVELLQGSSALLMEGGKFMCILPAEAEDSILSEAQKHQFLPHTITTIFHRAQGEGKRKVFLFEKREFEIEPQNKKLISEDILRSDLVLFEVEENGRQKRTEAYNRLSHRFYLR